MYIHIYIYVCMYAYMYIYIYVTGFCQWWLRESVVPLRARGCGASLRSGFEEDLDVQSLALVGQALVGPPWALKGWALVNPPALVGPPGPLHDGLAPVAPQSDTAHGTTDDVIVTGSGSGSASWTMTPAIKEGITEHLIYA